MIPKTDTSRAPALSWGFFFFTRLHLETTMTGNTKSRSKSSIAARKSAASRQTGNRKPARTPSALTLVWRDVTSRIRHTPEYLSKGWSHVEIIVTKPRKAPLPITSTGYLSHFLGEDELKRAGAPVRFFLDWIGRESLTKQWAAAEFKWRQGDLFA